MTTIETLKSRCEMIPWDGCWIWMNAQSHGYGHVKRDGKGVLSHRLMYELVEGPILEGMVIMHTCDHPGCINPSHLRLGTHLDNMADCLAKGRMRRTGNPTRGEDRPWAKLSEDSVRSIRSSTLPNVELGRIFGVSRKTIEDVRKGRTWGHVQ